jgi:hypothetical protein
MSTGTLPIPDKAAYDMNVPLQRIPDGADIVAAFLYWQTVETSGENAGQNGFFNNGSGVNYPISGTQLGNLNAPVSWSSGGCAGASKGSKTIVTYRADVSGLLPVDKNGNIHPNTTYQVSLPDSGKPGTPPFAEGATLVIIYRLLVPSVPLNAVVIYDGAYAPSNAAQSTTQPIRGFFDAGNDQNLAIATKITHIVANGQSNKLQSVSLNNVNLPPLNGAPTPFPGNYNGSWDNPTWFPNTYGNVVKAQDFLATTMVVPNSSNKGCVSWGAIVMSTTVQDSDLDGLPDVWKNNQGYYDAGANRGMSNQGTCTLNQGVCLPKANDPSWVSLSGATPGKPDVFIQLDYMCLAEPDGTANCDPANGGISYAPDPQALANLTTAFSANLHRPINVHIDPNHQHIIPALTCTDGIDMNGNPVYCPYPLQAAVSWEGGFEFLKTQPLNYPDENSCETQTVGGVPGSGPLCQRRFPYGQNNSYHEVIFGVAVGTPNWDFLDGSLTSVVWSGNTVTFTTSADHGLVPAISPSDTTPNARVTVTGAISNPSLNNTYLVKSVTRVPGNYSFTIQLATSTTSPVAYTVTTDPVLMVGNGAATARSGISDLGGANSLITLGLWGVDGQTVPVQSGTFMHELGHALGLAHGGLYRTDLGGGVPPQVPDNYSFSFEPNCKPNFQSVMNYMFQVDLLDGVLDYSEEDLPTLNEKTGSEAIPSVLANAMHPTTKWYAPNQAFGSAAIAHCDGTPLLPTDPPGGTFLLQGPASSITWAMNQDINFDGQVEIALDGYSDWENVDLRQIGASGNDFWYGGAFPSARVSGAPLQSRVSGAPLQSRVSGAVQQARVSGKDIDFKTANAAVRPPALGHPSVALTPTNTVQVNFIAPAFGQSQIASFNIYRKTNDGPFSKPAYANFPVTGMLLPLPNPLTFTDTNVGCGVNYSYFVTTVLSDGRESVQSNTAGPISVQCQFVGFLSPLSTASQAPAPPTNSGSRNLGNAAPVKWELLGANNQPISDLTTLQLMQACSTTGPTSAPGPGSVCVPIYSPLGTEGSTTFRYSAPNFIVNWDTGVSSRLTHGWWTLELQLSDGRTWWTNILF